MFIKAIFTDYKEKFYSFDERDSNYILIKLFNTPGIDSWFQYSKKLYKRNSYLYNVGRPQKIDHKNTYYLENINDSLNNKWNLIKKTLQEIEKIKYCIPFKIPEKFDFDQKTLNILHRFFTYNAAWSQSNVNVENPFDKSFKIPQNYNKKSFFYLIDQINKNVHFLEKYTIPGPNRNFIEENYPLEYLHFEILEEDFEKYLNFNSIEYQNNYNFLNLDYENIVTLDASILGKSVLQSFIDQDDPTKKDCQGRHCSAGGFMIYTDNQLKKIYTSTQFQNWIKEYNLEFSKIPYEFSIGYIQEQSTNLKSLLSQQLIKLEYID